MGVPKFFRWMSERYPKILQRQTFEPSQEIYEKYYGVDSDIPQPLDRPDPLSTCGLAPEIDCLYIDTNGVLHGCSHNNGDATGVTEEDIFRNVAYYLDRCVTEIAKPKKLVYIAIDGVAPRAKMNQQRSRRYRGGSEELEHSIYEAFDDDKKETHNNSADARLTGKFESSQEQIDKEAAFHSNVITPGTEFFQRCTQHLEHWIQYKLSTDERWQDLEVVFSGPNTPGEGEHKIMDYIRTQRAKPDYDPNLKHCIMGQDGDLVMLSLATHEPNMVLLREKVTFLPQKRAALSDMGLDVYLHNCNFEWLHLSVLRDYLMFEFETSPAVPESNFDRERTIQDFVFLTFFVGNDFLPSMPALDIGDEAFELIFHTYKKERKHWSRRGGEPYLTHDGAIVNAKRLEGFLRALGSHEVAYYDTKRNTADTDTIRKQDEKLGMKATVPSDKVMQRKDAADREQYREMLAKRIPLESQSKGGFRPVISDKALPTATFQPQDDELEEGFLTKIGSLLQSSITDNKDESSSQSDIEYSAINDQDLKGRYYFDKFGFSPFDAEKHLELRKAYIEGLVWNLEYYFQGCRSWTWYYPFHYGPMLSDLVDLQHILKQVKFDSHNHGKPLEPFEQLLGNMPPSSSHLLPVPYHWLMNDENSPISDFYPKSFTVDMNGKRWPWEAVILLPFVDAERLKEASTAHIKDHMLSEKEKERNASKSALVYSHDAKGNQVVPALEAGIGMDDYFGAFESKVSSVELGPTNPKAVLSAKILEGTKYPVPGYPTLTYAPIESLWRKKLGTNVHGSRSRYRTALLSTSENLPPFPPIDILAAHLIGTTVYINYPYLTEAFVTELSDAEKTFRGKEPMQMLGQSEREMWQHTMAAMTKKSQMGEGLVGSGGWKLPPSSILVSVRPLKGITTLSYGTTAKVFAKFTVTLPIMETMWSPSVEDPRTVNLKYGLEKDPFFVSQAISPPSSQPLKAVDSLLPTMPNPNESIQQQTIQLTSAAVNESYVASPSSVLPELDPIPKANQSILPPMDGKRGFVTFSLSRSSQRTAHTASKAGGSTGRRSISSMARFHPVGGNLRGKVGSLGIALAIVLAGTTGGANAESFVAISANRAVFPTVDELSVAPPLEFEHGTTTLSFTFQGGIIVAVDSRASLGSFVGSKTVEKVLPINSGILGTMAGGAADCSVWIRKIKAEAQLFELTNGYQMSVARASRLLANALHDNRGAGLSIGTMIMGYDGMSDSDPQIYYVDNTGIRLQGEMFSVGSGSTFALGILDKERQYDMSYEEAIALGIKAIRHATFRDAYSGGYINVYVITRDGWRKVFSEDIASSAAKLERQSSLREEE